MIEIILIELISIISFIYSLWLMFAFFGPMNEIILVFIWTVGASLVFALGQNKGKIYKLSILLLLAPIYFYREKASIIFILASSLIIFLYIKKSLLKGNHYLYANTFKKIYILYVVVIYFRLLLDGFEGSVSHGAPFIIICILSSVILTRTIRHIDSHIEMGKIRKDNIKHLIFIGLVFVITTFDKLRNTLWGTISSFFEKVIYIFFYPFYLIARRIVIEPVAPEAEMGEVVDDYFITMDLENLGNIEGSEELARKFLKFISTMKTILIVILAAILIYLIYKIIIKLGNRNYVGDSFTEEREYIEKERKKGGIFNRERYPKEFGEQIRYYYRRYLEKLDKANIEILETDTSLEVNEKAGENFHEEIEGIREIYINSRYGGKDVDGDMVEEMKELYKGL
ncbi:MAG: DUF4129 domain-containing protein [Tissierellia bacterium]|nr:DUF4129 domain-containing protein [Tissierellia bacterium]